MVLIPSCINFGIDFMNLTHRAQGFKHVKILMAYSVKLALLTYILLSFERIHCKKVTGYIQCAK